MNYRNVWLRLLVALAVVLGAGLGYQSFFGGGSAVRAAAAALQVHNCNDNNADTLDYYANGRCFNTPVDELAPSLVFNTNDSGRGSLRYAMENSAPGATVTFWSLSETGNDVVNFYDGVQRTIRLTSGQLEINQNLTIVGPEANLLTVSGNNATRVFRVGSGAQVTLTGLTIANGKVSGNDAAGGGILNAGVLTLTRCTVRDNSTTFLTSAGGSNRVLGGGIFNSGAITVSHSTLSGNSVSFIGSSDNNVYGGAIYNDNGRVTISSSTLSGNSAVINSYDSNSYGGAIYNNNGRVTISSSTLSGNSVLSSGGSFNNGYGGGIYNNGTVDSWNTIIAGNSVSAPARQEGPDVWGAFTSQGNNLIGNKADSSGFTNGMNGDKVGGGTNPTFDAKLAPLGDYGGPTQTMRPLPGSPAIDMGTNMNAPTTDQRGVPRPQNGAVEIGAVEIFIDTIITLAINPAANPTGAAAELSDALNRANDDPAPTTIKLQCGTYSYATAHNWEFGPNALPIITSEITIQGNGAVLDSTATTRLRFFYVAGNGVGGLMTGTLKLQDLTLQNGKQKGGDSAVGGGGAGMGGAIFNHGNVTLERVTLTKNTATGGNGGVFDNNTIRGGGGGLGEDGQGTFEGGGFGGTPTGAGGMGGAGASGGGGGGGFLPGSNGQAANGMDGGMGVGSGLLGGRGGGLSFSVPSSEGGNGGAEAGGGGGANFFSPNTMGIGGNGGSFGRGGSSAGNLIGGGGGGGVGGGGGSSSNSRGGGGGFGGGGGNAGGGGGFGGGGGQGGNIIASAGSGGFAGGGGAEVGGAGGGLGGAVFNHLGTLTLINCTLTANTAAGGKVVFETVRSLNADGGSGFGGAIFNLNGAVTLTSSTLAANTVTPGAGGPGILKGKDGSADGGAVYNLAYGNDFTQATPTPTSATVTISNSILANSVGGNDLFNDKRNGSGTNTATVAFNNGNLVMAKSAANGATESGTPTVTTNPNFAALLTPNCKSAVLPLQANSPALNAASVDPNVTTDQLGVLRQGNAPDLGAYEFTAAPTITLSTSLTLNAGASLTAAQLATVSDADQARNTLQVTATPQTGNGVTLGTISVDSSGNVKANVSANCGATTSTFTLKVTDNGTLFDEKTLTITVNPDDVRPQTNLTGLPGSISDVNVSFTFSGTDNCTVSGFQCKLDNGGWTSCTSPQSYSNLSSGQHTFQVQAVDARGNVDDTPASYTWTVFASSCGTVVNPATMPAATKGTPFVQTFSAAPTGSYVFSLLAGQLPPGVTLVNTLGIYSLRGTPTTSGNYTFTIKAKKNNSTCEGARTYTIAVP